MTQTQRKQPVRLVQDVCFISVGRDQDNELQCDQELLSRIGAGWWQLDENKRPWANLRYASGDDDGAEMYFAVRLEWLVLGVDSELVAKAVAKRCNAVNEELAPLVHYADGNPRNCCRTNLEEGTEGVDRPQTTLYMPEAERTTYELFAQRKRYTKKSSDQQQQKKYRFRGVAETRAKYLATGKRYRLRDIIRPAPKAKFESQYRTLKDCYRADYTLRRVDDQLSRDTILRDWAPLPAGVAEEDLETDEEFLARPYFGRRSAAAGGASPAAAAAAVKGVVLDMTHYDMSSAPKKQRRNPVPPGS